MLNIEKLAEEILRRAKEEFDLLKSFYKQNKIDDFGIDYSINFHKNNQHVAHSDKIFSEEDNLEKTLESISTVIFTSHKAERELGDIRNSDFALYKITSLFQVFRISVKLEELESLLLEIELELLRLRNELHSIYFKKSPYYSMSATIWTIFEDPDAEEVSLEVEDFKYLNLYPHERTIFSNFLIRFHQFKRLCGEEPLKVSPIEKIYGSLDVSVEWTFSGI